MDKKKYLLEIDRVIKEGTFKDNWDSLSNYKLADWYRNAKFGIFIHWGVYSVPAFGSEWYPRNMYIQGSKEYEHHIETYGNHKDFGYKDFIPMFKAENFNAEKWAEVFKAAGAKYVVPVAEHHDGFQMYKSELSHFNYHSFRCAQGTKFNEIYCLNLFCFVNNLRQVYRHTTEHGGVSVITPTVIRILTCAEYLIKYK